MISKQFNLKKLSRSDAGSVQEETWLFHRGLNGFTKVQRCFLVHRTGNESVVVWHEHDFLSPVLVYAL